MAAAGRMDGFEPVIIATTNALKRLVAATRAGARSPTIADLSEFGGNALLLLTASALGKGEIGPAIQSFCILTAPASRGGSAMFDQYIAATAELRGSDLLAVGGLTFWPEQSYSTDGSSRGAVVNAIGFIQLAKNDTRLFDDLGAGDGGRPFSHPIDLVAVGSSIYASLVATALHMYLGNGAYNVASKKAETAAKAIGMRLEKHGDMPLSQAAALKSENLFFICTANLSSEGNTLLCNVCAGV